MEEKKNILIGVTASISIYKTCEIVRKFVHKGFDVRVVATPASLDFIGEIVWRSLSQNDCITSFAKDESPNPHITYSQNADLFLIAPASANTIAKMANGIADNVLTASYLAAKCPIVVAPAMNEAMYENPATQANINALKSRGVKILEPKEGNLACGGTGKGALADVDDIVDECLKLLS